MIIFFKNIQNIGGPSSFQRKFIEWLKKNKIEYDFLKKNNIFKKKILFINSGTFNILLLFISSLFRTKIIQRLNGFYDLKKVKNKYYLRCFLINFSMQLIRKYLSDYIIYQSEKSKTLWDKNFGKVKTKCSIIYNPSFFQTTKSKYLKSKKFNILIVEGNLENETYYKFLLNALSVAVQNSKNLGKIIVFGNVDINLKNELIFKNNFKFMNSVSHLKLKNFYKNNRNLIFFGIEFNPSCSNSIIEATSYGIPSITLDTGSYKELIGKSGIQISYKSIHDKNLKYKIFNSLRNIIINYKSYSYRSINNSKKFYPKDIFNKYLKVINS